MVQLYSQYFRVLYCEVLLVRVLLGVFYSNAEVFRGLILSILGLLQVVEQMYCKYCQHSKYSSCPSVNLSCKQMGMKLSNQCINDRSVLHTPSILRIFGVLRGFAVPTDEILPVLDTTAVTAGTCRVSTAVTNLSKLVLRVRKYPQYPEILRVLAVSAHTTLIMIHTSK